MGVWAFNGPQARTSRWPRKVSYSLEVLNEQSPFPGYGSAVPREHSTIGSLFLSRVGDLI